MKSNEQKAVGHTAGEWKVINRLNESCSIEGPEKEVIANVIYNNGEDVRQANARLITCAPDMLEALELVLMTLRQYDIGHERQAEICAIIARAKGEA